MKKLLALVMCFMFLGVGSISAQTETSSLLKKHTFELGPEISYIIYKEPGLMEEKGMMYGLFGSYTYHNKLMLKVEGKGSWGQVDYDGELQDGTPYTIDNITDYMLEFRGLVGYDFPVAEATIFTPYIGIGYRYLNDDSSSDPAGYERESNYLYSPIGISFIVGLANDWSIGVTGEYDYFWGGKQKSHLSDFDPGLNDVKNRQKKGYGLRGSIALQKKIRTVAIKVEPFIRYWNIKKSETETITYYGTPIGTGWEPKNNSTEVGVMLGVKF
jgi:hypothetical protein